MLRIQALRTPIVECSCGRYISGAHYLVSEQAELTVLLEAVLVTKERPGNPQPVCPDIDRLISQRDRLAGNSRSLYVLLACRTFKSRGFLLLAPDTLGHFDFMMLLCTNKRMIRRPDKLVFTRTLARSEVISSLMAESDFCVSMLGRDIILGAEANNMICRCSTSVLNLVTNRFKVIS